MLVNIIFRLRPAFTRKEASVRAAAFTLFGTLCRFGSGIHRDNFNDQVHQALPMFLVHMNDKKENVREAAHEGFKKVVALMGVPKLVEMVDAYDPHSAYHDNFLEEISPVILELFGKTRIRSYLDSTMVYFSAKGAQNKQNSVYLTGCLLKYSSEADRKRINANVVVSAMLQLLKDKDQSVIAKTCKALSLLHSNI